jgi:hypothetical protein
VPVYQADPAVDPDEPGRHRPPDAPRPGGRPGSAGADRLPFGPARSETVHHVTRAQAEVVYAAHRESAPAAGPGRDSWAAALPSLRAAWQEHLARYPERERATPLTHPDGSWSSGETRRLTPEQNTEATKACADIHDEGRRFVYRAMLQIEAADPSRRLASPQHMLKGEDRLKEKIADILLLESRLTPREALEKVPDAVRYTFIYSSDDYATGVEADVERLKAAGFEEVKLKNLWTSSQYKGINTQWRRPETGLRFEVQCHTPESLQAKELTHAAYERLRRPEDETTPVERDELEEFQRRANELLATPPGAEEIKDFPERKR